MGYIGLKRIKIAFIFLFAVTSLALTSCNSQTNNSIRSSSDNNSNVTSIKENNDLNTVEESYYEQDEDWFKNNPIDKAYLSEISKDTTIARTDISLKYLTIWKKEVGFSAANLAKRLTSNDVDDFIKEQKTWESWADSSIDYDEKVMNDGTYGIDVGTSRQYIYTVAKINLWRDRDLHIKYLTSLIEAYNAKPFPKSQWTWDKFNF